MSDRSQKSIFAHKQTYSLKGNSKSRSVRDIAHENERLDGACPHVADPQPPVILEGMRPSAVVDLIESRVAAQNRLLRQLRKEQLARKDALRAIRIDTHVLIASVFSFPDLVADMDEAEYLRWRNDVIAFARDDAVHNGAEVLSIIEHRDESQPSSGPGLLEGLSGFLHGMAGWVNRLADASPHWLKWPETVAYAAQSAKHAFGSTWAASTLAGVIEASPAWQSFTREAKVRLEQARAVQALTNRPRSQPGTSTHMGI